MMPRFLTLMRVLTAGALFTQTLYAQAVLRGHVTREGTRAPVAGAEVILPQLERRAFTDSGGAYVFDGLRAGTQPIQIRKVGFAPGYDSLSIPANATFTHDFVLSQQASLDTMRAVAEQGRAMSPVLRSFEERRLRAESGHFLSTPELRKLDDKNVANILIQRVPGITIMPSRAMGANIVSTRKLCSGRVMSPANACKPCFVTVYQDGQLAYRADERAAQDNPPMDFNRVQVSDLAGIEFYSGTGVAPPEFNGTGNGCGTLILWSRER